MIVIGTDTHKRTHTCGAVDALTAAARGELTVPARMGAFGRLLRWARALDPERVWASEDCRHVSGAFERFLIARGERIVRVAPKHTAGARRASRERGKSDSIDAFSVARAALKEGIEQLPERTSTARRWTFACWSTTVRISSPRVDRISSGCAGTCTTSGQSSRSPTERSTPPNG
jgi:transposase